MIFHFHQFRFAVLLLELSLQLNQTHMSRRTGRGIIIPYVTFIPPFLVPRPYQRETQLRLTYVRRNVLMAALLKMFKRVFSQIGNYIYRTTRPFSRNVKKIEFQEDKERAFRGVWVLEGKQDSITQDTARHKIKIDSSKRFNVFLFDTIFSNSELNSARKHNYNCMLDDGIYQQVNNYMFRPIAAIFRL